MEALVDAGVWGLVRSAQSESPGRVWLVDIDGEDTSRAMLPRALACEQEPQLAIRGGEVLAPRLARAPVGETHGANGMAGLFRLADSERSVLVTGGDGRVGWSGRAAFGGRAWGAECGVGESPGLEAPGAAGLDRASLRGWVRG